MNALSLDSTDLAKISQPGGLQRAIQSYFKAAGKPMVEGKRFADAVLEHGVEVNGKINANFFTGTIAAGYTNMKSFIPEKGENYILTHIRALAETYTSAVGDAAVVEGLSALPLLSHGKLSIYIGGDLAVRDIPLSVFTEADESPNAGIYKLNIPIIWSEGESMDIQVAFTTVNATAKQVMWLQLFGLGTY